MRRWGAGYSRTLLSSRACCQGTTAVWRTSPRAGDGLDTSTPPGEGCSHEDIAILWFLIWPESLGFSLYRVPTAQGKQGKWPKKFPARENTGNLEILSKHRKFCQNTGIFFAQVVNALILNLKYIVIFATIFFFPESG